MKKTVVVEAEQIQERVTMLGPYIRQTEFLLPPGFRKLLCIENHMPNAVRPPIGFTGLGSTGKPHVHAAHREVEVKPGDWIIKDNHTGEVWAVAGDKFEEQYLPATKEITGG